ncbi:MAG: fructose-6-phosphate aldolase [Clostridia bacterium]|nr:fructose-6-phosphate aldolase [Clostridia bacterium]
MKLLIDDANLEKIGKMMEYYPCDGVTTNPSILAKEGKEPYAQLKAIRSLIGNDMELHVQVVSLTAEEMVIEAEKITEILGKNTYIKVPSVPEGIKAMKMLKEKGFNITATAIYTAQQAYLAAKAGADYVAPYINRIDNLGADGVETAKTIQNILENNDLPTEILAASFKNSQQVLSLCEYGVGAATAAPDIIEGLLKNPTVTAAVDAFVADFEKAFGEGKTMLN